MIITRAYLERFGFSDNCKKCCKICEGDESQPTLKHSDACRERIEGLLRQDPELASRVERADER